MACLVWRHSEYVTNTLHWRHSCQLSLKQVVGESPSLTLFIYLNAAENAGWGIPLPLLEHARPFRLTASASELFTDLKKGVEVKKMLKRKRKSRAHGGRQG